MLREIKSETLGTINMEVKDLSGKRFSFDAFARQIEAGVSSALGEDYKVYLRDVVKNNGVKYSGLFASHPSAPVLPLVHLDWLFESYQTGVPMSELVDFIVNTITGKYGYLDLGPSDLADFSLVKDRVCVRLVNMKRNEELLENVPHIPCLDLAIVFRLVYQRDKEVNVSSLVENSLFSLWHISINDLFNVAMKNTALLFPLDIFSMSSFLSHIIEEGVISECDVEDDLYLDPPLYVMSNTRRMNGATSIIYPGALKDFADKVKDNLFILPSSIHEVIIIPESMAATSDELQEMVFSVNGSCLDEEDILSGSVYFYDRESDRLVLTSAEYPSDQKKEGVFKLLSSFA